MRWKNRVERSGCEYQCFAIEQACCVSARLAWRLAQKRINQVGCGEAEMSVIGIFSVIIVNYNTPKLVRNCVQSVLDSSIAGHEDIVVVDNASTDNSFSY